MDILEFESFFHQLVPHTDQERKAMADMNQNATHQDISTSTYPQAQPGMFLPNYTQDDKKGVGVKRRLDDESPTDGMEENEKQKVRRANQNLACRNYRRRKKEYVQELETKISSLEAELEQLRKENSSYKRGEAFESIDPALLSMLAEMKQILEKLDDAVKTNADDKSISYLLQLFFLAIEKRHTVANKEIDKLVNPLTQAKLATMGYVPAMENPIVSNISGPNGNEWWASYAQEARMTEDQARSIRELRERHWKLDAELRVERNTLDKSIKDFFLQNLKLIPAVKDPKSRFVSGNNGGGLDMGEVIEFARQLNCLKKNFVAQRTLMVDVQAQLNKILSPRQHAILLLRINASRTFDWPRHVQTLRSAWQLFAEEKA
jgi:hypothetical protein